MLPLLYKLFIVAALLAGIAFYLYFLVTQREFAYREWKNQMMTTLQVCHQQHI